MGAGKGPEIEPGALPLSNPFKLYHFLGVQDSADGLLMKDHLPNGIEEH